MNANDISRNQLHLTMLRREAEAQSLARLALTENSRGALRARLLAPLGHRLLRLGAALVATAEPGVARTEHLTGWAS